MSKASEWVRTTFQSGDDLRDAELTTPENVTRYDDIVYGEDPVWQSLDVYRPKAAEGQILPVIVSVHGGGWVYGDKQRYQYYCMDLAQRGFAVVNFSYRLAPENKFPAALEDTNTVFAWTLEHAERYGFDSEHIFAVGDSAGAHLLGLYAAMCTNPVYAEKYFFKLPTGFSPAAIALNCGVYRIDPSQEELTAQLMEELMPSRGTKEELDQVCVVDQITDQFPPTFFMTSSGDFLKAQAPTLAAKLAGENVPFVYRFYAGKGKELPHVFHCDIRSSDAKLCSDEECSFFREFL